MTKSKITVLLLSYFAFMFAILKPELWSVEYASCLCGLFAFSVLSVRINNAPSTSGQVCLG